MKLKIVKCVCVLTAAALLGGCTSGTPMATPADTAAPRQTAAQTEGDSAVQTLYEGGLKPSEEAMAMDEAFTNGTTDFAFRLLNEVSTKDESALVSPISVSVALGMLQNGADGDTRAQLLNALGLGGMQDAAINKNFRALQAMMMSGDASVKTNLANALWLKQGLPVEDGFIAENSEFFGANLSELDFSDPKAADIMNDWVKENTGGKIDKLVSPPLDPATLMHIMNAVYFEGRWSSTFEKGSTKNAVFHAVAGEKQVPTMSGTKSLSYYKADDGAQLVTLPYASGRFAMYFLLPKEGDSLNDYMGGLTGAKWRELTSKLEDNQEAIISLPKFKFDFTAGLKEALQAAGIKDAFDSAADFSRMTSVDAYVGQVSHKAFIEVDENGTVAAAATDISMLAKGAMPPDNPLTIALDRPFMYAIQDTGSGAMLFMGTMYDPSHE